MNPVYDTLLEALESAARQHYGDRLVSLAVFGSVGRGTPTADSDLDILCVVAGLPRGRIARVEEFAAVESALAPGLSRAAEAGVNPSLSPVLKTPEEIALGSPLMLDMVDDARILFDRGAFLAASLDRLRARLAARGARRIWRGNAWIWDLKPDYQPGEVFEL
jgi:predicted nucleotidyltransferase